MYKNKFRFVFLVSLYCQLLLVILFSNIAFAQKRVALVIGNSDYKTSPLANPANDATDMSDALGKRGFEVDSYTNLDRKGMRQAIRAFGDKLKQADVGLFYYAGHGIQIKGKNYLVPLSADVSSADEVQDESIDANSILRKMESAGNDVNIVILDACRNNPFTRSFRSLDQGLARMEGPVGSFIAYATAPGSVAADGRGRNGIYTHFLLQALNQSGLAIEQTFKSVRNQVKKATNGKQIPWESSSLMGEFVFFQDVGKNTTAAIIQPPPVKPNKYLQIIANVPNAKVSINSVDRGIVNSQGVLNINNIQEDQVEVLIQAEGYKTERKRVTLVPNQWEKLNIVMIPSIKSPITSPKTQDRTANNEECINKKRAILTTRVEYIQDNGKAVVKRKIPELKIMLIQAFKKYGLDFIDVDFSGKKQRNKNKQFAVFKRTGANYLIRFSSTVNENTIKTLKTNMKTIAGDLSLEMIDVKNRNISAHATQSFRKAGLDRKQILRAALKKQVNILTEDLVSQVCDI